ncbi:hypothetical protein D083_0916 [Dickeya solani RNS 08.23.3.1.A]|nr:hypothetical protein D083_0916 [Dickeya solani RNS 08.23.3.1.A]
MLSIGFHLIIFTAFFFLANESCITEQKNGRETLYWMMFT